jgi:hypothetical protein
MVRGISLEIRYCGAIFVVILSGCGGRERWYAMPEQRPPLSEYKVPPPRVINMSDPDATVRFVRDITDVAADTWRWTGQSPAVRVRVRSTDNLKYVIDFTIAEITFKETGPVTVAFTVNGRELDRVHYTSPGAKHFEKAVPAGWLAENKEAVAGAEIDKLWTSKGDGARFGFILTRIGFTQ